MYYAVERNGITEQQVYGSLQGFLAIYKIAPLFKEKFMFLTIVCLNFD